MATAAVLTQPDAVVDTVGIDTAIAGAGIDADAFDDSDECALRHPLTINIRPILESVAGLLTDDEIDQWLVGCARVNEGGGFYLELTGKGELVINPMVNIDSNFAETELGGRLYIWNDDVGGRTSSPDGLIRLPDGSRVKPDAAWLSPAQLAELPIRPDRAITVCPTFVAEIMSHSDRLPPLQRKMERYIANGAQLGWLIDPYHRRVYIYRPGVPVTTLDDPETVSGDPVLPGFTFAVRQRIFALHD